MDFFRVLSSGKLNLCAGPRVPIADDTLHGASLEGEFYFKVRPLPPSWDSTSAFSPFRTLPLLANELLQASPFRPILPFWSSFLVSRFFRLAKLILEVSLSPILL